MKLLPHESHSMLILFASIFATSFGVEKFVRCPVNGQFDWPNDAACTTLPNEPDTDSRAYFFYEDIGETRVYYGCDDGQTFCAARWEYKDQDFLPGCYASTAGPALANCQCDLKGKSLPAMEAHPDLLDKFVKYAAGKERCGVAVGWANVNHHMPKTVLCDVAGPPYTQEKGCWTLPSTRSYESLSVAFYEMFTEPDGKQIRVFYSCATPGYAFCKHWWDSDTVPHVSNATLGCYKDVWRRWFRWFKECLCENTPRSDGPYNGKLTAEDKLSTALMASFPGIMEPDGGVGKSGRLCGAYQQFTRVATTTTTTTPETTTTPKPTTTSKSTTKATKATTKATRTPKTSSTTASATASTTPLTTTTATTTTPASSKIPETTAEVRATSAEAKDDAEDEEGPTKNDLFLVLLVGHACLGGLLVLVAAAAARLYQMNRPAAPHRQSVARRDSSTSNVSASRSRSSASNSEERKRPVARSLKRPRQH